MHCPETGRRRALKALGVLSVVRCPVTWGVRRREGGGGRRVQQVGRGVMG